MTGSEGNVSVSQMILIHISISRSFPQDLLGSRKFPSGDPGCQSFPRPYDYTNSVLNGPRETSHLPTPQDLLKETSWNREDPEGNFWRPRCGSEPLQNFSRQLGDRLWPQLRSVSPPQDLRETSWRPKPLMTRYLSSRHEAKKFGTRRLHQHEDRHHHSCLCRTCRNVEGHQDRQLCCVARRSS